MISLFTASSNKVINSLADKSIRADRRRNIFIITTIAFASCLMMSLALYVFGGSYQTRKFYQGRLQAAVLYVNPEQFTALSEDETIEQTGLSLVMPLKELRIGKDRLSVTYYDETAFLLYSHELTQGRLPEKEAEIAIPASYLEKQGIEPVLGQAITLELGPNAPSEYTVCGLMKDEDASNSYEVLVSQALLESYFSDRGIPYAALIRMAGSEVMGTDELKQYILDCMEPYGFDEADIAFSSSYFNTFDNASSNTFTTALVSILIMIACSTVIYSLFYISVTGKVKEYGRLRIVGITQKQMKRLVRKESRKLSLLSIPLGIVIGCIIGYLLIPDGWYLPNTVRFAVITAFVMEITVRLSIRKPVRIAASVSPVEAVRITTTDVAKLVDTKKLHRKITPYSLAGINFSRNRKRTVLTLFSLGFTGIFLMCASTIMLSINPVAMAYQRLYGYEFEVSLSPTWDTFTPYVPVADKVQQNNPLNQELFTKLTEEVMIGDMVSIQGCTANMFFPDNVNVEDQPYYDIVGLSREYIESHQDALLNGTLDYDKLVEEHGIIIDDSAGMVKTFAHYEAVVGDTVQIETDEGEKIPFKVMATANLPDKLYGGYYIFVPQDLLNVIKADTTNFNLKLLFCTDLENISQAEDIIYEICGSNPELEVRSINEMISFLEESLKILMKAAYVLVVFIGIFALINLLNTLMTNFVSRQQEFGVLRSVGLSDKQLSKMLWAESFHYVLAAMALTLTIGTVLGYILCWAFSQIGLLGELDYTFPLLPMLIFFAALVVIALGYSVLAVRYCEKRTLAEYVKGME